MLRKAIFALLLLAPLSCFGQVLHYQNFCQTGAQKVTTQGLQSTTNVQRSYPRCTVAVYLTGTTTLATIYSDGLSTPLANPFTANTDGSFGFWASPSSCYDATISGGNPGDTIPTPFTFADICLGSGGGGGGGIGPGTVNRIAKFVSTSNVGNSTGFDTGTGLVQWDNGLSSMGSAYGKLYPNSPTGTADNLLACIDPSVVTVAQVTTCPTSTAKAIGVIHAGSGGVTGNAQVTMLGFDQCVFDNQTVIGDYVGPSSTVAGECTDTGAARPANIQGIGRVTTVNTGAGTPATIDLGPWDLFSPGSSGGSGTVSNCASSNSNAFYPSPGAVVNCDPLTTDDGNGNMTMKSAGFTDTSFAGFFYQKQGTQPALSVANSIYVSPPTSVGSTFGLNWPGTLPTNGNCVNWNVSGSIAQWADAGAPCGAGASGGVLIKTSSYLVTNSDSGKLVVMNCSSACTVTLPASPSSTFNVGLESIGSTVATISLNSLNYNGNNAIPVFNSYRVIPAWSDGVGYYGHAPLIAGTNMTFTPAPNGMTLNSGSPVPQASNPSQPTLATIGSAGSTSYTYGIIGCEDVNCVYHSAMSTTQTIATGNATLTSSNAITIKAYADTLYGYRFYKICRTASAGTPSSTGVIATGAGKWFLDSGLAGDSTNCASTYASNTTILDQHCLASALPAGINVMPGVPCGVDSIPTSPNALDEECTGIFGTPGDTNNIYWTKVNFGSATTSWSNGNCVITTDTTSGTNFEGLAEGNALPGTPYTFTAFVSLMEQSLSGGCVFGLRESGTAKMMTMMLYQTQSVDTDGAGYSVFAVKWTSNTANSSIHFIRNSTDGYYLRVQNDGTNINLSYSPATDGTTFKQLGTATIASSFTTGPDQLVMGANSAVTNPAICVYDWVRRTQ